MGKPDRLCPLAGLLGHPEVRADGAAPIPNPPNPAYNDPGDPTGLLASTSWQNSAGFTWFTQTCHGLAAHPSGEPQTYKIFPIIASGGANNVLGFNPNAVTFPNPAPPAAPTVSSTNADDLLATLAPPSEETPHMREPCRSPRRRVAFTLIELLVVMALILAITALGIGYVVFGQDNQHSVTAGQAVTGALLNAKGRARREPGRPAWRPVRSQHEPGVPTAIHPAARRLQLRPLQRRDQHDAVEIHGRRFQGGASFIGEIDESTVHAGDYFTVSGVPTPHRITQVLFTADSNGNLTVPTLNLASW